MLSEAFSGGGSGGFKRVLLRHAAALYRAF